MAALDRQNLDTWKRAQNLQVATVEEGALIGRLDDFQFDLDSHRIFGWRLKAGGVFARVGGVRANELVLVGRDLALIRTETTVEWGGGKTSAVDGRSWASAYRGTIAVSRRGRTLGAVTDFVLDRQGDQVTGLLLQGGLLLPLDGRVNTGLGAVIAETEDAVVQLGDGEAEERTDWWDRLKDAVGVRSGRPAIKGPAELDSDEPIEPDEIVPASDDRGR